MHPCTCGQRGVLRHEHRRLAHGDAHGVADYSVSEVPDVDSVEDVVFGRVHPRFVISTSGADSCDGGFELGADPSGRLITHSSASSSGLTSRTGKRVFFSMLTPND